MFDSLKSRFKNLFKKGEAEPEKDDRPPEKEGAEPVKAVQPAVEKKTERPADSKKHVGPIDDDDIDALLDDLLDGTGEPYDDVADDEPVKASQPPAEKKADVKRSPEKEKAEPAKESAKVEPVKTAVKAAPPIADNKIEWKSPVKAAQPVVEKKTEPAKPPQPAADEKDDDRKLSRKDRVKLAKQEKAAAKEAEREKKHDDAQLVGDSGKRIKEGKMDDILWELEVALMEADVALPVVEEIKNGVKEDLIGKRHARGYTLDEVVEISVKESILKILRLNEFDFDQWFDKREKPVVIMFVGINGTGKTTAIAKIANRLMKNGKTVVLAASDTFRAGAIEQLTIHSERLGCKIVKHAADADPAAVAFDAIEHAKAKRKDAVLVDTAGRMQTNSNLMDEMKKIKKVTKPDLVMFVGDSLAGNDAVEQARAFDAAIGVDAIMLTKIDADSKGGAALSIAHTIGKPIAFVSNGQAYDQIVKFNSKWMMDRLFED
ncbi:MAG: signal recognition particle-docking protein FtsY [Methanomassiliicoccaceae archaeon]|jgi:fused signal recognition particle receptor|nr:signal recognition particle-docking protein FtsY [Methanomassiliicoccaceae archaeon]